MLSLFGPVDTVFADEYLTPLRRAGECLCLGADVPVRPDDTWAAVLGSLPAGWLPDRILLWLPSHPPDWVWTATVPVIGLAADWEGRGHLYRHTLPLCDAVLAEPSAAAALTARGLGGVWVGDLSGLGRSALEPRPEQVRDIDVLVIDPLPAGPRPERAWAGRVAQLAGAARVVIRRPTSPAEDRAWIARAKVVVQLHSPFGNDRLAYEAVAASAALARMPCHWDGPDWLRPGVDYAPYTDHDFEEVVLRMLAHEEERRALATAARARAPEFTFDVRLGRSLAALAADDDGLARRMAERLRAGGRPAHGYRVWVTLGGGPPVTLPSAGTLGDTPELAVARGALTPDPAAAAEEFRHGLALDSTNPVAAANLAEALVRTGRLDEAAAAARSALERLGQAAHRPATAWDVPVYPPQDDLVRAEWDRAFWSDPTGPAEVEAKRGLLRWRLHTLLARLTDDLSHYHEAALAHPTLPAARAALGCALGRRGRAAEGLWHLRAAAAADPFDRPAARALAAALEDVNDGLGRRDFLRRQHRLAMAAPDLYPAEPWFSNHGLVGDELVSVVVVVHNQPEITRACLDGLIRNTRHPYELVLVDNGSEAATAALLDECARRLGPGRAAVVRTGENLGHGAAANRGLAAAQGGFLVLLDNDAVVTPGWLEGLLEPFCAGWPEVGLVGPVTNAGPDPQRVPAKYSDLTDLDAFALAHRRAHAGAGRRVQRLSGFCLLTHRAVYEKLGPLDERLGRGFYGADDWCVRARRAGYAIALAADVYVHHFGGATFRTLKLATAELLQANLADFRDKWGEAEAASCRPPGSVPRRPTVSLCMIVKNEENNLPDCLTSVRGLVDEMIVVDTGSADRTREVAAGLGARVVDFPWVDSFAAARNESLRHATGDWVFWMDADDRLLPPDRLAFREFLVGLTPEPAAYVMKCRCLSPAGGAVTVVDHVRLFRNDPRLRWKYRVHEQILPAVRAIGLPVRWAGVSVTHVGYTDPDARRRKLDRDLRLLRIEEREQPGDPFTLFNLGSVVLETGDPERALPYLQRSLDRSDPRDSIVRKLYALIAQCHRSGARAGDALAACSAGRVYYPDDAELLYVEGLIRQDLNDWEGAVECWRRLTEGREGEHFASVDAGLRGAKARHNLAVAYSRLGRWDDATAAWRVAAAEDPGFVPAWAGLGEAGLAAGDRVLIEEVAERLSSLGDAGWAAATALRDRLTEPITTAPAEDIEALIRPLDVDPVPSGRPSNH